jgi:hypothetical protein
MILLECNPDEAFIETNLFSQKSDDLKLIPGTQFAIVSIKKRYMIPASLKRVLSNSSGKLRLYFDKGDITPISPLLFETLFDKTRVFSLPDGLFKELCSLNTAYLSPPIVIRFSNCGDYVRMEYIDIDSETFIERELDNETFDKLRNVLAHSKTETDIHTKNGRFNEAVKCRENCYAETMRIPGIDLPSAPRRIDILFSDTEAFIPVNFGIKGHFCRYMFPDGKYRNEFVKKNPARLMMVYCPDLKNALTETSMLSPVLSSRFDTEIIPVDNFDDYRSSLLDCDIFHFTGHGEIEDNIGKISLNKTSVNAIDNSENTGLFILNCCDTGNSARGIIENIFKSNPDKILCQENRNVTGFV